MGPLGLGPVAIAFMWNVTGRAAGSVFIGEKSSKEAAAGLYDAITKELGKTSTSTCRRLFVIPANRNCEEIAIEVSRAASVRSSCGRSTHECRTKP